MLTDKEEKVLISVAKSLGTEPKYLHALINFESGWNPQAKNPTSSAKGLIQFMDSTARDMGFASSQDLINKYPTIEAQLKTPVKKYLAKYAPFSSDQDLFMAVFYPVARTWSPLRAFPQAVQNANPSIKTVQDYINYVYKKWNPSVELLARLNSMPSVITKNITPTNVWILGTGLATMTYIILKLWRL